MPIRILLALILSAILSSCAGTYSTNRNEHIIYYATNRGDGDNSSKFNDRLSVNITYGFAEYKSDGEIKHNNKDEAYLTDKIKSNDYVTIYIHGLNNSFNDAILTSVNLKDRANLTNNHIVINYSWPAKKSIMFIPIAYTHDQQMQEAALPHFKDFLENTVIKNIKESAKLNIVAHSMGNRIIMNAIESLRPETVSRISTINLIAADLGYGEFSLLLNRNINKINGVVTVYTSVNDYVLLLSCEVSQIPKLGRMPASSLITSSDSSEFSNKCLNNNQIPYPLLSSNNSNKLFTVDARNAGDNSEETGPVFGAHNYVEGLCIMNLNSSWRGKPTPKTED